MVNDRSAKPKITVVGSCIVDVNIYATRLPRAGESLVASRIVTRIGGKASNQAIAITRLGGEAWLIAKTGGDEWANLAVRLWQNEGVNVSHVCCGLEEPTGMGIVVIDKDGQNFTLSSLGANATLSPRDLESAKSVIGQSGVLSLHLNPPLETILRALMVAKQFNVITLLNASPVERLPDKLFRLVDVLVCNHIEASQLVRFCVDDFHGACLAGEQLIGLGSGVVIVSFGGKGLVLVTSSEKHRIPAFEVPVIDTTGAGDALIAGLAVALAEGRDILSAVRFAGAASAISVSRLGTCASMPTREEVDDLLSRNLTSYTA